MISYDIASPNDINSIATWVEFALCIDNSSISKAELSSSIEGASGEEPQDTLIAGVWNELKNREFLYGTNPPFRVIGQLVEPQISWLEKPYYLMFLIYNLEGNPNTSTSSAVMAGTLFEDVCTEAIKKYIGGGALRYGFPSTHTIKEICENYLFERFQYDPPASRNDRNVDIIAWKAFDDLRASQIVLLVQCASGLNWKSKLKDLNINSWRQYINFAAPPPLKGFAAPVILTDQTDLHEASLDSGIFFDRLRLYRLIESLPQELVERCTVWCEGRLTEIL